VCTGQPDVPAESLGPEDEHSCPDSLESHFQWFSFSPDGQWLATTLVANETTDIYVADLTVTPLGAKVTFNPVTDDGNSVWPTFR
jgi:Tol biopolymer transport system component